MKIMIKSTCGKFFSKEPEVGLTDIKKNACIFYCHNEEHAFLILEKTKRFISN